MSEDETNREAIRSDGEIIPGVYYKTDRERAMLTQTDRQLLLDEKEYDSDQALRNARHRLREHIRNSLPDIFLIANFLDQSDLEQLVERQLKVVWQESNYRPVAHSAATLDFATQLLHIEADRRDNQDFIEFAESEIMRSLQTVTEQKNDAIVTEVDVNISMEMKKSRDKMTDELLSSTPTISTVTNYLSKIGGERLRETLQQEGTEVNTAEGVTIGPDHDLINEFVLESDEFVEETDKE